MSDPVMSKVFLYITQNDDSLTTDDKVLQIASYHLHKKTGDSSDVASVHPLRLNRTARGKPFFIDRPDLHFSVSHSGDWFVCAISDEPVGVDLQEPSFRVGDTEEQTASRFMRIAKRFFHPAEVKFIQDNPLQRFLILWTARESYVKFTGQGIDNDFSDICVLGELESSNTLCVPPRLVWQADHAYFIVDRFAGYTLCTCTPKACEWDLQPLDISSLSNNG